MSQLRDHFEANYPRYYNQKYKQEEISIPAIQNFLSRFNQGLIEYFVGEEKIYGFVLWKEGITTFQVDDYKDVVEAIGKLRNSISRLPTDTEVLQNYQDFSSAATYLYNTVFAPALTKLPKDIQALKIIPDYQFNYVPFDLLLMEEAPKEEPYFSTDHLEYVLEKYQLSYEYSATLMLKNQRGEDKQYQQEFYCFCSFIQKSIRGDQRSIL